MLTVYAVWYSASLFEENGWTPPQTWDDAIALGAEAKKAGKYLFLWGKEAATYYQTLAIASAIKEGGDEVRLALENLDAGCWSLTRVQGVFEAMGEIVVGRLHEAGRLGHPVHRRPGPVEQQPGRAALPVGLVDRERDEGPDQERLPDDRVPGDDRLRPARPMPYTAMHSTAGEPFVIPSKAKNVAGGKELLRTMLSKEAATNFAKEKLAPDDRQGHRARRRLRVDGAGVAEQDAHRRRHATSSPGGSSTSTA